MLLHILSFSIQPLIIKWLHHISCLTYVGLILKMFGFVSKMYFPLIHSLHCELQFWLCLFLLFGKHHWWKKFGEFNCIFLKSSASLVSHSIWCVPEYITTELVFWAHTKVQWKMPHIRKLHCLRYNSSQSFVSL